MIAGLIDRVESRSRQRGVAALQRETKAHPVGVEDILQSLMCHPRLHVNDDGTVQGLQNHQEIVTGARHDTRTSEAVEIPCLLVEVVKDGEGPRQGENESNVIGV